MLGRLDAAGVQLAPAATKQEQYDTIFDRLASVASRTALVVVVEDLHWADAASLDLLAYLATKVQHLRVLILASFRPDELHPDHPATAGVAKIAGSARPGRIDLSALAGVELRTFIDEALAGFILPDETRRAIALAGDGNPFFTEELLKSAGVGHAPQAQNRGSRPPSGGGSGAYSASRRGPRTIGRAGSFALGGPVFLGPREELATANVLRPVMNRNGRGCQGT